MECQRCLEKPGYHSFQELGVSHDIHYFYCFPANNKKSVRTHEDMLQFVSHFPKEKQWSLFFHANGYGLSHMMPLSVAIEMGKIVQKNYSKDLQKIYIVEGSWFMQFLIACIFPFLGEEMKSKFVVVKGSLLEVIHFFEKEGIPISFLQPLRDRFGKIEG